MLLQLANLRGHSPSLHSPCNGSKETTAETTGNRLPLLVWVYAEQQSSCSISWVVNSHFDEVGDDDSSTATSQRHVFYCFCNGLALR